MAKFLQGNELNSELGKLFANANNLLILISPFIKLHERFISELKAKKDKPELKIIIVFGKNEDDVSKSMKSEDLNFFKDFLNIEIRYEKRLHAKYYANESSAILSSMNLYSYSHDNNIEAGIMLKSSSVLGKFTGENNLDSEAGEYFERVIDQSDLLYKKEPEYESSFLGISKKYKSSIVTHDNLSIFFSSKPKSVIQTHSQEKNTSPTGYCIRTSKKIPFNTNHPMSEEAYQSWAKFSNKEYSEKYCHFSGEESHGETSFSKPILRKNWKKAKDTFGL